MRGSVARSLDKVATKAATGVTWFVLMLLVMTWNARRLYRMARDPFIKAMALGWFGGLCGALVVNLFGGRLHSEEVSGYFWILCALVVRAIFMVRQAAHPALLSGRRRN